MFSLICFVFEVLLGQLFIQEFAVFGAVDFRIERIANRCIKSSVAELAIVLPVVLLTLLLAYREG
jgi:hypothetical protein